MTDLITPPRTDAFRGTLEALARSDLFGALPEATLRELAAASSIRDVRRGDRLWAHGSPSATVALVASGGVRCWSRGHDQRQWVSGVVRQGGVCGLAPCVDGGAYTCNAEPIERSRIAFVPATVLRAVMEREPAFARRVAAALAREVRRVLSVCEDMTLHTPLERLAHFLEGQSAGAAVVRLREPQTQIAAQLGTVREVVGRAFRRLEAEGVVARSGRVVRILRPEALAELARNGHGDAAK
jgi:CRP-like cAMP-binding protein